MKLSDLRKAAVRQQLRIRFRLSNGMECVLNEQGVAQVPSLRSTADFNLEDEFAVAEQFEVETLPPGGRVKTQMDNLDRKQLAALVSRGSSSAPAHDDSDE